MQPTRLPLSASSGVEEPVRYAPSFRLIAELAPPVLIEQGTLMPEPYGSKALFERVDIRRQTRSLRTRQNPIR